MIRGEVLNGRYTKCHGTYLTYFTLRSLNVNLLSVMIFCLPG